MHSHRIRLIVAGLAVLLSLSAAFAALHNISAKHTIDPVESMFEDLNNGFIRHWKARSGTDVTIKRAIGRSGKPVQATVDGLDVVPLVLSSPSYEGDALQKNPLSTLSSLQQPFPQRSPYMSTIVFLVRKGNPKNLKGWDDLIRHDVEILIADPKTSARARWGYLAAWGYAFKQSVGNEETALKFMDNLFANAYKPVFAVDGALKAFIERGLGDVVLAWESEAHALADEQGGARFEVVTPTVSILAEPMVSVVAEATSRDGARDLTQAYADFLNTPAAQDIAGKHHFRPRDPTLAEKYGVQLPPVQLFSIDEVFGGWKKAWNKHFSPGGIAEQLEYLHAGSQARQISGT